MIRHLSKRVRISLCILAAIVLLGGAGGGFYVLRVTYIKNTGITLTPSAPHTPANISYFLQNDPRWAKEIMGSSGQTLAISGCLVSCAASAIEHLGIDTTPGGLNKKLTDVSAYSGASLIWYKVHEAVPQVTYRYSRLFSSATIEKDLDAGLLPLVNVKYYGNGGDHWVMIVGATAEDFLICDPLNTKQEPLPLSTHGKVYSYRVLVLS